MNDLEELERTQEKLTIKPRERSFHEEVTMPEPIEAPFHHPLAGALEEFTIKPNGRKRSFYEESDYELDWMTSEEIERSGLGEIVYI